VSDALYSGVKDTGHGGGVLPHIGTRLYMTVCATPKGMAFELVWSEKGRRV